MGYRVDLGFEGALPLILAPLLLAHTLLLQPEALVLEMEPFVLSPQELIRSSSNCHIRLNIWWWNGLGLISHNLFLPEDSSRELSGSNVDDPL
jgi:hypothetical protein